ncbi:MAG: Integral membrane protein [uncultured Propionibacteriaceae bacterium]|uniref:Integral membrane protein n=1 Tax=uncultured Propionibacteriaceae bacterium TaxID=257457 RepID=A0A6J4NDX1_9ACTN|nr:MAG: Integral membrane protein [uncultured Propionibacteriaceae bacterium]
MAAATLSAEERSSALQRTLAVALGAVLEVALVLLGLTALAAALSSRQALAAGLVTLTAAAVVGRAYLRIRGTSGSWLGSSGGARSLLVVATAVAMVDRSGGLTVGGLALRGLTAADVAALLGMVIAVALIVLEPHLMRLSGVRMSVVANLSGVEAVPPLPRYAPVAFFGGLLATVTGSWLAASGLAGSGVAGWIWLLAVLLAAAPVAALAVAARRRLIAGKRMERQINDALAAYAPEFLVYTARPDDASHQVLMWLPYLQRAGRRFLIVARDALPAAALAAQTDVPVVQRRALTDLDSVVTPATRAAFYVNASSGNGAFVRYHQLTHVYLGHGDSDKPPSYNPIHAMFDRIFAAGPAAIRRYAAHGVAISPEKFEVVGRPQVEGIDPAKAPIAEVSEPVVLYAPTWRGHVEETLLYSLPVGERIVQALLDRKVTVIFRPHPFSYDFEPDRESIRRIQRLLAADTQRTGRPHKWGEAAERELGISDCINESDAMVSDVSSVVSDYLFSAKPFAMVAVSAPVDAFEAEYPVARAAYVVEGGLSNLDQTLDLMLGSDPMADRRADVKTDYLGDFPAEGYADAFISAVRRVVDRPHSGEIRGIDASDEPETTQRPVSIRRRVAGVVRDAVINGFAAAAAAAAIGGAPVLAAVAAVLSVAAIVWSRRRVLRRRGRWVRLLGSNVITRMVLVASLAVAAADLGATDTIVVVAVAVLAVAVVAERNIRTALARQELRASGLPGLDLAVRSVAPWGATTVLSWLVIVVSWLVLVTGLPSEVLLMAALVQLVAFAEPWVRSLIRVHRSVRGEEQLRPILEEYRPQFAIYFASTMGAAYQIGMWLPYLERLDRRFIIITRTVPMLRQLQRLVDIPVVHRPTLRSLEEVVVDSMTAAFYVNNAVRNTHFVERRELSHVWLNHGDSEKPACYNPVHAIYDRIFAAGQAAIDRYARHGVHIPPEKFQIVGRPQVEAISKAPRPIAEIEAPTVLYAPTWRGPFADSRVYSLTVGNQIVSALLARGATVIFRAHSFNYRFAEDAKLVRDIGRLLADDRDRTGRQHLWGRAAERELTIEECFNASDAMISDVSAVVSDYLQADKPMSIVSVGRTPEQLASDVPAAHATYILREDCSNLDAVLDELLSTDSLAPVRNETRIYYLGDFPPDQYAEGFVAAARAVVDAGRS